MAVFSVESPHSAFMPPLGAGVVCVWGGGLGLASRSYKEGSGSQVGRKIQVTVMPVHVSGDSVCAVSFVLHPESLGYPHCKGAGE